MPKQKLEIECPVCDAKLSIDARSCPKCGADLGMADFQDLEMLARRYFRRDPHKRIAPRLRRQRKPKRGAEQKTPSGEAVDSLQGQSQVL